MTPPEVAMNEPEVVHSDFQSSLRPEEAVRLID
jgi:hypothetical protein